MSGDVPQSPKQIPVSDRLKLNKSDSELDVRERVIHQLNYPSNGHCVYYVECELYGSTFEEAKRKAAELLPEGEAPDWLYPAWKASEVYYIGQTSRISQRLADHHCHVRKGDGHKDEPSRLTAISLSVRAGIVARRGTRHGAEVAEKRVANAWRADDDRRFVYYS